jgi:hypothetical protein
LSFRRRLSASRRERRRRRRRLGAARANAAVSGSVLASASSSIDRGPSRVHARDRRRRVVSRGSSHRRFDRSIDSTRGDRFDSIRFDSIRPPPVVVVVVVVAHLRHCIAIYSIGRSSLVARRRRRRERIASS